MSTEPSGQKIEAPTEADVDRLARQWLHVKQIVAQTLGGTLDRTTAHLPLLQATLDAGVIEPEATYSLQAMGIAFGIIFVSANEHFDWCMVEDEYGRDPAIRYKETWLLVFPQTMISKRVEDGDDVDVQALYEGLVELLEDIRARDYPDA